MSEQSDDAAKAAVENNLAANLENTSIGEDENSSENNKQPQLDSQQDENASSKQQANNANNNKIEILLKAVGNAPILKKKKFLLERTKNVNFIIDWLKKYMKLDPKEQLFLYVNQEFAPSPDAEIGTIYDCFHVGNNVIFHYCTTPAWG